jgi:magnesium-transporting ATPase (P-type)
VVDAGEEQQHAGDNEHRARKKLHELRRRRTSRRSVQWRRNDMHEPRHERGHDRRMNQADPLRDPSTVEIAAVIGALDTDVDRGLTAQEAARRLAADGPNELRAAPAVPAWRRFLAQFQDPLIYLLLGAVAISLGAWWIEGRAHAPVDAIVIALIVVVNAALGHVQEA